MSSSFIRDKSPTICTVEFNFTDCATEASLFSARLGKTLDSELHDLTIPRLVFEQTAEADKLLGRGPGVWPVGRLLCSEMHSCTRAVRGPRTVTVKTCSEHSAVASQILFAIAQPSSFPVACHHTCVHNSVHCRYFMWRSTDQRTTLSANTIPLTTQWTLELAHSSFKSIENHSNFPWNCFKKSGCSLQNYIFHTSMKPTSNSPFVFIFLNLRNCLQSTLCCQHKFTTGSQFIFS